MQEKLYIYDKIGYWKKYTTAKWLIIESIMSKILCYKQKQQVLTEAFMLGKKRRRNKRSKRKYEEMRLIVENFL